MNYLHKQVLIREALKKNAPLSLISNSLSGLFNSSYALAENTAVALIQYYSGGSRTGRVNSPRNPSLGGSRTDPAGTALFSPPKV
jgi:hypothetical protein